MVAGTQYDQDLTRLRDNPDTFAEFARRHTGIVKRIAGPWVRRCPDKIDIDDVSQEVLEAIWRAVDSWDPERGVTLPQWVRKYVRFRLLKMTARLRQARRVEMRHIQRYGQRDDTVCDESAVSLDDGVEYWRRAAMVIGSIPDRQSADFIARVLRGHGVERARQAVYLDSSFGGAIRKSRRAINNAIVVAAQLA